MGIAAPFTNVKVNVHLKGCENIKHVILSLAIPTNSYVADISLCYHVKDFV